jgi:hypothetical protein
MFMCRGLRFLVFSFFVLLLLTLCTSAQQSPSSADTFVSSGTPTANYGAYIIDVVGPGTSTYLKFNLSGIPSGAAVSKATLRLYVDAVVKGGQFDVYSLPSTPSWSENTLTYNSPPPAKGVSATGGHPITVSVSSLNTFVLIDITSTVQGWLLDPSTNNGVVVVLLGNTGNFAFDSKESSITKLLASTGATLGTFSVETNPVALAFDGANIWVANTSSDTLTKIPAF